MSPTTASSDWRGMSELHSDWISMFDVCRAQNPLYRTRFPVAKGTEPALKLHLASPAGTSIGAQFWKAPSRRLRSFLARTMWMS